MLCRGERARKRGGGEITISPSWIRVGGGKRRGRKRVTRGVARELISNS